MPFKLFQTEAPRRYRYEMSRLNKTIDKNKKKRQILQEELCAIAKVNTHDEKLKETANKILATEYYLNELNDIYRSIESVAINPVYGSHATRILLQGKEPNEYIDPMENLNDYIDQFDKNIKQFDNGGRFVAYAILALIAAAFFAAVMAATFAPTAAIFTGCFVASLVLCFAIFLSAAQLGGSRVFFEMKDKREKIQNKPVSGNVYYQCKISDTEDMKHEIQGVIKVQETPAILRSIYKQIPDVTVSAEAASAESMVVQQQP